MGIAAGILAIPVVPEMLEAVQDDKDVMNVDTKVTENLISGLYISFTNIGEAIGPTVSSFMIYHFGF